MYNQPNHQTRQLYWNPQTLPGLALTLALTFSPANASEEDTRSYQYLKSLEIEQLIKVEVTLDDVFDVFDGLIKAKSL